MDVKSGFDALSGQASYQQPPQREPRGESKSALQLRPEITPAGPVVLRMTEHRRREAVVLTQEIIDAESDLSLVQTVESALERLEDMLLELRELSRQAANGAEHNTALREADQQELEHTLEMIEALATATRFRSQLLLDGSHAVQGMVSGEHLEFLGVEGGIPSSPIEGYTVEIHESALPAQIVGTRPFTQDLIDRGEQLWVREGNNEVRFQAIRGKPPQMLLAELQQAFRERELPLEAALVTGDRLSLQHLRYGNSHKFAVASTTPGVLSPRSLEWTSALPGRDVKGVINGEPCEGRGQTLQGRPESPLIAGLALRYTGTTADLTFTKVGTVSVLQNAIPLHLGGGLLPTAPKLSLRSFRVHDLGRNVPNLSEFRSLEDVHLRTVQGARDTEAILDGALSELGRIKERLDELDHQTLRETVRKLKHEHTRLNQDGVDIQDSKQAHAVAEYTRDQIIAKTRESVVAQANQQPQVVLGLLK